MLPSNSPQPNGTASRFLPELSNSQGDPAVTTLPDRTCAVLDLTCDQHPFSPLLILASRSRSSYLNAASCHCMYTTPESVMDQEMQDEVRSI